MLLLSLLLATQTSPVHANNIGTRIFRVKTEEEKLLLELNVRALSPRAYFQPILARKHTRDTIQDKYATRLRPAQRPAVAGASSTVNLPQFTLTLSGAISGMYSTPFVEDGAQEFGRVGLDYLKAFTMMHEDISITMRALHIPHHLLLFGSGLTLDVNHDRMFRASVGLSCYDDGRGKFITTPWTWLRFNSSQETFFLYGEFESLVSSTDFLSATAGIGIRPMQGVELIAGLHHSEFVSPLKQKVNMTDGLHVMMTVSP
jgi:hypothetical protein